MKQTISSQDFKRSLGEHVNGVRYRGDRLIIEQRGVPVAAIVPLHVLESYERNRDRLVELMETVAARNADQDPEALERMIEEEIAASREERRAKRQNGERGA